MGERLGLSRRDFNRAAVLAGAGLFFSTRSTDSSQEGPMTLSKTVGSDGLNLVEWNAKNGPSRLMQLVWERFQPAPEKQVELVQRYFSSDPRPPALKRQVERIMTGQLGEGFKEAGIESLVPETFMLLPRPRAIATSSKREIGVTGLMTLRFGMTEAEIEALEERVETLLPGTSALVFDCNGSAATYPPLVIDDLTIPGTLVSAAHEITHDLLAFTPLGSRYTLSLLGFPRDNAIATMNETLADMVGQEIGRAVMDRYYRENQPQIKQVSYAAATTKAPTLNYDQVIKETRIAVDWYLSQGQVDKAEALMNKAWQDLTAAGFYIRRRINQAYLAIHGIYADEPAATDPIGEDMKKLRQRYPLGKVFWMVSDMTGPDELQLAA